jgi:hypothetical protein
MTDYSIGASDVAAILGLSKWTSPAMAWARLKGIDVRDSSSPATERGKLLETAILMEYAESFMLPYHHRWHEHSEEVLGRELSGNHGSLRRTPGVYAGPPYSADRAHSLRAEGLPWATCRPDGYRLDHRCIVELIEVKTTRGWGDWEDEEGAPIVPAYYFAQVQWQMFVTGIETTTLQAFCVSDDTRRSYTIPVHAGIISQMVSRVTAWRDRYLVGDDMPDGIPARIAGLIYPVEREPEEMLPATPEAVELVEAYRAAGEAERAAVAAKEQARDKLCMMIADASGIDGLCTWRASKSGKRTFRLKEAR